VEEGVKYVKMECRFSGKVCPFYLLYQQTESEGDFFLFAFNLVHTHGGETLVVDNF